MRRTVKTEQEQISICWLCIKEPYTSTAKVLATLEHPSPHAISEIPSPLLLQQPGQQLPAVLRCLAGTIMFALGYTAAGDGSRLEFHGTSSLRSGHISKDPKL